MLRRPPRATLTDTRFPDTALVRSFPMQMNGRQRLTAKVFLTLKGLWHRMTLGSRVMVVDGDKVLLIRHTYVPGWQFPGGGVIPRSEEHTSALQSLMRNSYAVFCLQKKNITKTTIYSPTSYIS